MSMNGKHSLNCDLCLFDRYRQDKMVSLIDDSIVTWLLTCICAPQCIRNPYIIAKLVEVLFVISPTSSQYSGLQVTVCVIKMILLSIRVKITIFIFLSFFVKTDYESSFGTECIGRLSNEILH